jgi:hypothetical protein
VVVEEEGELQLLLATGAMVAMVSSSFVRGKQMIQATLEPVDLLVRSLIPFCGKRGDHA